MERTPSTSSSKNRILTEKEHNAVINFCRNSIDAVGLSLNTKACYDYYLKTVMRQLYFEDKISRIDIEVALKYLALKAAEEMHLDIELDFLPTYKYIAKCFSLGKCYQINDSYCKLYFQDSLLNCWQDREMDFDNNSLSSILSSFHQGGEKNVDDVHKYNFLRALEHIYLLIVKLHQFKLIEEQKESQIEDKHTLTWIKENLLAEMGIPFNPSCNMSIFDRDANIESRAMAVDTINRYFDYFGTFNYEIGKRLLDYSSQMRIFKNINAHKAIRDDDEIILDNLTDELALKHPAQVYHYLNIQYKVDGTMRTPSELGLEQEKHFEALKKRFPVETSQYLKEFADKTELYNYLNDYAEEKKLQAERVKVLKGQAR